METSRGVFLSGDVGQFPVGADLTGVTILVTPGICTGHDLELL